MLLWLALGCAPPTIPDGELQERYTLRTWQGEPAGEDRLGLLGGTRVEHLQAHQGERELRIDASLDPDGAWREIVRIDRRWERYELRPGPEARWSRWKGLLRLGGPLSGPVEAIGEGYLEGGLPGPESSLLAWSGLAAAPRDAQLQATDPRSGKTIPMSMEVRERRTLRVRDTEIAATRLYAWTGTQGHTLWVDDSGRVLSITGLTGALDARLEGFEPPLPELPTPPAGLVVEPQTIRRPGVALSGQREHVAGAGARGTVLFLHGSGPGTRDGDYGPVRAGGFRQIAWPLEERGYAALRYDKRGAGDSHPEDAEHRQGTLEDLEGDAAAWQDLGGPCQFLIGHSEGAYLAVALARRDPRVQGVILLGGPANRIDVVLRAQLPLVLEAEGASADEIAYAQRGQTAWLARLSRDESSAKHDDDLSIETRRWLASHLAHDPEAELAALRVPVLAIFGEQDIQVPPSQEASRMREIFQAAGDADATVMIVPGMDHLLGLVRPPRGLGAYYDPDRRVAPEVIQAITDWLDRHPCPSPT